MKIAPKIIRRLHITLTAEQLEKLHMLAKQSNRDRSEVIGLLIDQAETADA